MLDHHHRAAELVADPHQQRPELLHLTLGHAGGGLVEQQHLGLVGDRAGELDDATCSRRQLRAEVLAVRLEVEELQQLADPPGHLHLVVDRRGESQRRVDQVVHGGRPLQRHRDGLGDGQPGEEPAALEGPSEPEAGALLRRERSQIGAGEADSSAVEWLVATDQVEQRRLAGAVLADQADDLPGSDRDAHVLDRADPSEAAGDADQLECRDGPPARRVAQRASTGRRLRPARGGVRAVRVGRVAVRGGTGPGGRRCGGARPDGGGGRSGEVLGEEHGSQQVGAFQQLLRWAGETDPTAFHEVRGRRDRQRHVDRLLHEHDSGAPAGGLADELGELADHDGRQPEAQLVDEQQPRPGQQRHPEAEHLLLAAGQVRSRVLQPCPQDRERLEHRFDAFVDPAALVTDGPARGPQVVSHGERREHARATGNLCDTVRRDLAGWGVGDVATVQEDRAEVGFGEPRDRSQQCGLAGAVGAEERDDLALRDLEVDVEEDLELPVGDVEVVDDEQL